MKSSWVVVLLVFCVLLVGPASGLATDKVGVFFDQGASEYCREAEQGDSFSAYLVLLEPRTGVFGWECTLEVENLYLLNLTLNGSGLNVGGGDEYKVGLPHPLPMSRAVELARMDVLNSGSGPGRFLIYPVENPSLAGACAYADGSDPSNLLEMAPATISGDRLVAGVNLPNCLPESSTWGRVKSNYSD